MIIFYRRLVRSLLIRLLCLQWVILPLAAHHIGGSPMSKKNLFYHYGQLDSQPLLGQSAAAPLNQTLGLDPLPPVRSLPFNLVILLLIFLLVVLSGLLSGLSLGLMSLDVTHLRIIKETGTEQEKIHASKVLSLRKNNYLLLCTLLISNALINEALPILMQNIAKNPTYSVLLSTFFLVVFAEIIPQAFFSKFGLVFGAKLAWLVQILVVVFFPIVYPLSLILNKILGPDNGTQFKRKDLKELIVTQGSKYLSESERSIINGALTLIDLSVEQVMIPLELVFMLEINAVIDESTIDFISKKGYSRIPLYESERNNIVGILLAKTLISSHFFLGKSFKELSFCKVYFVSKSTSLYFILSVLRQGLFGHLAIVIDPKAPKNHPIGIITLEDIIEEILQKDIIDETDEYIDVRKKTIVRHVSDPKSGHSSYFLLDNVISANNNNQYLSPTLIEPSGKAQDHILFEHKSKVIPVDSDDEGYDSENNVIENDYNINCLELEKKALLSSKGPYI